VRPTTSHGWISLNMQSFHVIIHYVPCHHPLLSGTALRVPKKPGESCLKPEKKTKAKHTSYLNTRTGHVPRCGGPRGPPGWPSQRPPRTGSASLEGSRLPRVGSASLEGSRLPRAGSASLEGSSPPRSRLPHKHACSRTRVRAFNALTQ
jgi:hypothetical protein